MLGAITFNCFAEGETIMRNAKLKLAAVVTAVLATLGTVGATATIAGVDAGKTITSKKDANWCC